AERPTPSISKIIDTWGFLETERDPKCSACKNPHARYQSHLKCHKCLNEGYIGDIYRPKQEKEPLLLIDTVFRQTFKKGTRDPALRKLLINARRIALSDEMAAFLYTLRLQIILGNEDNVKRSISRGRSYRRLDDC